MSLKSQPEFEAQSNAEAIAIAAAATTTTTTKEETVTTANTTETTTTVTDAGAQATMAIATAAASSATAVAVAKPATKLVLAFSDKHSVFDIPTVEGLSLAVQRMKGEQGSFFVESDDYGDKIQFEIISVSPRWVIGTGEDDKEAKDYFRVSYDNETISGDNTTNCHDYLASLKAQGFEKARKSDYLDIFGFVVWSSTKGAIAPEARQLACLQCSPTSKGAFTAFSTTRGLLQAKGIVKEIDIVEVHAEKRTNGSNKFTNFSFHAPAAV